VFSGAVPVPLESAMTATVDRPGAPRFALPALGLDAAGPLPLLLVFALAVGLRLPGYLSPNLYVDEANTWLTLQGKSLLDYLTWRHHAEHPPALYMVETVLVRLFGDSRLVLRLPALVAGLFCIPAAWAFGRQVAGRTAGLWLALFVAVDPNMVQQTGFARMYTPFMLELFALFGLLVFLVRDRGGGLKAWAAAGLLLAAILWTCALGVTVTAGLVLALIVLVALPRRITGLDRRTTALGGALAVGIALALSVAGLATRLGGGHAQTNPLEFQLYYFGHALHQIAGGGLIWPAALAAAVLGLVLLGRREPVAAVLVGSVALANLVGLWLLMRHFHSADARHVTAVQPMLWLGWAALASAPLAWPRLRALLMGAVALAQAWHATHLLDWYPRPASYAFSSAVDYTARLGYGPNQVIYWPSWYYATPAWQRRPIDWDVQAWTGLIDGRFPAGHEPTAAPPRRLALVVAVHEEEIHHDGTLAREGRALTLGLARRLGTPMPESRLAGRFPTGRVTVVEFHDGRVDFHELAPSQWGPAREVPARP
jgi:hypothetical protein